MDLDGLGVMDCPFQGNGQAEKNRVFVMRSVFFFIVNLEKTKLLKRSSLEEGINFEMSSSWRLKYCSNFILGVYLN